MLKASPFVPCTIVMSDGTHITVKHPENALLMKHWIYVATDCGGLQSICTCCTSRGFSVRKPKPLDRIEELSILS